MAALGIDFGSSFCTVSWLNPQSGKPEAVKFNGDGSVKLPSVLLCTEDGFILGFEAQSYLDEVSKLPYEQRMEMMADFIPSLKRILDPKMKEYLCGKDYSHLTLLKKFFEYLIGKAKDHCGSKYEIDSITFAHPVDFPNTKVKLIEKAIRDLGYDQVSTIEEPVAAVKGYGIDHQIDDGEGILVFDFGGGTIDVAFVRKNYGELQVAVPPKGNSNCGGQDFDYLLYDDLRKKVKKEYNADISENGVIDQIILSNCRRLKEKFSGGNDAYETVMMLFINGKLQQYKYRLSRETFNNIIYKKVSDAINVAKQVVNEVKSKQYKIDKVLLIGGSSQLSLVRELLSDVIGDTDIDTCGEKDIAVALGCLNIKRAKTKSEDKTVKSPPDSSTKQGKVDLIPIDKAKSELIFWN